MPETTKKNIIAYPILLAAIAISVALGLIVVHTPLGRDQGVAAYVAMVMERGGVVYKDVYHFNLPAIFFVYRAAMELGFEPPVNVNLIQVLFTMATCPVVFLIARRMARPVAAGFAALFYALFQSVLYTDFWDVSQKESLACLPLALSLLFFLVPARGKGGSASAMVSSFFAGVFAGLSAQFKPTLGIVLLTSIYLAWRTRKNKARAALILLGAGVGFAVSFIPLIIYLHGHGAMEDFIESFVSFGGFYGGQYYSGVGDFIWSTAKNVVRWLFHWRFLSVLALTALFVRERRAPAPSLVAVFGALLLIQVVVQMKYFTYHWIPLLIPISALAAQGGAALLERPEADEHDAAGPFRRGLTVILLALLIGNLAPEAKRYYRHSLFVRGMTDETSLLRPYGKWGEGDINPLATREVAIYLRSRTVLSDPVLVFGHELGLYVLANRLAPTRFAYDQPLVTDPAGNAEFASFRETLRSEFIFDLESRPPKYILIIEDDETGIEPEDSYTQMLSFPRFRELIESDYVLETKIEDFFIYRREADGDGGGR